MQYRHPDSSESRQHVFLEARVDLRVYLVPIQVFPVGPSKGAAVLLSIRPPTVTV